MSIPITCGDCGQKLAAPPKFAGRQVACPKCKAPIRVPGDPIEPPVPVAQVIPEAAGIAGFDSRLAPGPPPMPSSGVRMTPAPVAVDAHEAILPPQHTAKSFRSARNGGKSFNSMVIVAAVAALAVVGGGFAAFHWLGRDGVGSDLRYLPDDCDVIATVDVRALWNSGVSQKLKSANPDAFNRLTAQMEHQGNVKPEDFGRMTWGFKVDGAHWSGVLHLNKAITDADLVRPGGPPPIQKQVGPYKLQIVNSVAFCLVDGTTMAMGDESSLNTVLPRTANARVPSDLEAAMKEVDFSKPISMAVATSGILKAPSASAMAASMKTIPGGTDGVRCAGIQADVNDDIRIKAVSLCKDAAIADQFKKMGEGLLAMAKMNTTAMPPATTKIMDSIAISVSGAQLTATMTIDKDTIANAAGSLGSLGGLSGNSGSSTPSMSLPTPGARLTPPIGSGTINSSLTSPVVDPQRARVSNDLRQIGIALLTAESKDHHLPAPAICDAQGNPLLSWRVAILPYIGQQDLYDKFSLNESWNSDNNKKLLGRMPNIYRPLPGKAHGLGKTCYLAITGEQAAFFGQQGRTIADFKDGTSRTIVVVEAGPSRAVEWTKPDDLPIAEANLAGGLFGQRDAGAMVLFGDCHIGVVRPNTPAEVIHAACTIAGGETTVPPTFGNE